VAVEGALGVLAVITGVTIGPVVAVVAAAGIAGVAAGRWSGVSLGPACPLELRQSLESSLVQLLVQLSAQWDNRSRDSLEVTVEEASRRKNLASMAAFYAGVPTSVAYTVGWLWLMYGSFTWRTLFSIRFLIVLVISLPLFMGLMYLIARVTERVILGKRPN
jgi:hypothetical protein